MPARQHFELRELSDRLAPGQRAVVERDAREFGSDLGHYVGVLVGHEKRQLAGRIQRLVASGRGDGALLGAHPVGDTHRLVLLDKVVVGQRGPVRWEHARTGNKYAGDSG